jgi:hypothetical protein
MTAVSLFAFENDEKNENYFFSVLTSVTIFSTFFRFDSRHWNSTMRARLEVILSGPGVHSGVRLPSRRPPLNSSWLGDPVLQLQKLSKKNPIFENFQKHGVVPEGKEAQLHIPTTQPPTSSHYHTRLLWGYQSLL